MFISIYLITGIFFDYRVSNASGFYLRAIANPVNFVQFHATVPIEAIILREDRPALTFLQNSG